MQPLLSVENIARSFGGVRAVRGVSLDVMQGEILGLIGPNGAGKTTFFNLLAGALRPDDGTISYRGGDITDDRADVRCRRGIARTFQIPKPFVDLTVEENLLVARYGGHKDRVKPDPAHLIDRLGLRRWASANASVLPLGARKRLEIARALATGPDLLLLDEVMGGLSEREIEEVLDLIREIHRDGVTIVMIEHVLPALMAVVQRVAVLNEGALIALGLPGDVTSDPRVIEAYLGTSLNAA